MNTLTAHSLGPNPLKILDFLTSIFRLEKRTVCLSWQLVLLLQTENQYLVQRQRMIINVKNVVYLRFFIFKNVELLTSPFDMATMVLLPSQEVTS